ncbi:universal stress protein [Paraburkholderia oxyphila]|uniref:universal stress protein n=1 Tax=Paraburkholderia oxyphila TaxID=614212 RepID=UPI0004871EFA|nr:universal stress protein [Paraburkholderia oxyphila]
MQYKTLLVYLDPSERAQARLDFSLTLAGRFDAHLIGLYSPFAPEAREYFTVAGCAPYYNDYCNARRAQQEAAEESFRHALRRAGMEGEWIGFDDYAEQPIIRRSRHADLLVAGQAAPDDEAHSLRARFLEGVVMTSGRPVLVLPYAGALRPVGDSIVIAWDGSREAARAVHDAMALLPGAKRVTMLHIGTPAASGVATSGVATSDARIADLDAMLARHAVNVDFAQCMSDSDETAGDTLLSWVATSGCDLVVAGAYGHPHWRERLLGGVTRALLESATVPVLLSH